MSNRLTDALVALLLIAIVTVALALWFGPLDNCRTVSPAGREFVVACKNVPDGWKVVE